MDGIPARLVLELPSWIRAFLILVMASWEDIHIPSCIKSASPHTLPSQPELAVISLFREECESDTETMWQLHRLVIHSFIQVHEGKTMHLQSLEDNWQHKRERDEQAGSNRCWKMDNLGKKIYFKNYYPTEIEENIVSIWPKQAAKKRNQS